MTSRRSSPEVSLRIARTSTDVEAARSLFREYASMLGVDLCFQNFETELARLPGDYANPSGTLVLARRNEEILGCIAVRPLGPTDCEMKRLFVRDAARGLGIGRKLATRAIGFARRRGYRRMFLDTLPLMKTAQAMYETLGFVDTEPYRPNPVEGARFMVLSL